MPMLFVCSRWWTFIRFISFAGKSALYSWLDEHVWHWLDVKELTLLWLPCCQVWVLSFCASWAPGVQTLCSYCCCFVIAPGRSVWPSAWRWSGSWAGGPARPSWRAVGAAGEEAGTEIAWSGATIGTAMMKESGSWVQWLQERKGDEITQL